MTRTGLARRAAASAAVWALLAPAADGLAAQTTRDPARTPAASAAGPAKAVRADEKTPLKRVSGAMPVFPPDARLHGLSGIVTMDVTVDVTGKVSGVHVLRSIPTLEAAATDAVRKWTYDPPPALANGTKVPRTTTVVFYFDAAATRVDEAVRVPAQGPQPRKTKSVPPTAPPARGGRTAQVMLEAVVDRLGKVVDVRVLSGTSGYATPAREAVKQWEYEPMAVNGNVVPFVVTVTLLFH
jgi:TonB family protein